MNASVIKRPDRALSDDPKERKKAERSLLMRFINWRERHMSNRVFLFILSIIDRKSVV